MAGILQMHKFIFLYENCCILFQISQIFSQGSIHDKFALVQIMDQHNGGNRSLTEPVLSQFIETYMHHLASMSHIEALLCFWWVVFYLTQGTYINTVLKFQCFYH